MEPSVPDLDALLRNAGFLRGVARGLLSCEADADDVVQDAMVKALERKPAEPRPWLVVTVRNFARMLRRGDTRRARRERAVARTGSAAAASDVVARLEIQRRVVEEVLALPEPYRSVIVFRFYDDEKLGAIAKRLDVPVETVKTRLKRALARLREGLDRETGGKREAWTAALLPLAFARRVHPAVPLAAAAVALIVTGVLLAGAREDPLGKRSEIVPVEAAAPRTDVPAPAEAKLPPARGPTHGLVRDEAGAPVAKAAVTIVQVFPERSESRAVATDGGGAFSLDLPDRAPVHRVAIRHPDYAYQEVQLAVWKAEPETILLKRGAPVRLLVTAQDQTPAAGAAIEYRIERYTLRWMRGGKLDWKVAGGGSADAAGLFSLGRLPDCEIWVRASCPGSAPANAEFVVDGREETERTIVLPVGGAITGTVFDPAGVPVAVAKVRGGGMEATTGADGRYRLADLTPGATWMEAQKEGFAPGKPGETSGWGKAVPVHVEAGVTVTGIDIRLREAAYACGRVVDDASAPVAGAKLMINGSNVVTDAEGRFRAGPFALVKEVPLHFWPQGDETHLFEAPTGGVLLVPGATTEIGDVAAVRRARVRGRVEGPLPPGVFPLVHGAGRTDLDLAFDGYVQPGDANLKAVAKTEAGVWVSPEITVEGLAPGELREGLILRVVPGLAIHGRVTNDGGAPRTGAAVEATRDGARVCSERTDAGGRYVLHVPNEGSYEVRLEVWPHLRRAAQAGDGGVDLVVPRDELPGTVTGRVVRKSDGAPVPEFNALFIRYKWLVPGDTYSTFPERGDGTFAEELEEPGTYALEVVADGYAAFTTKTFAVEQGKTIDIGTILLGAPARIRGVVRDASGDPVQLAQVHVLSSKLSARWRPPFTDRKGRFEHDNLEPDTYTVFAVSPQHPLLIRRDVTVRDGETAELELLFAEAAPLTLVVLDGGGRPVEGALFVYTFPALRPYTSREVESYEPASWGANRADAEGKIRKPWLPPGPLSVTIEAKGFATDRRDVELKAGEETRVEVRLGR